MRVERENAILAWHFLPSDGRLQHKHNGSRGQRVEPGDILHVDPPLEICIWGLHASRRAIDALEYAPGAIVCRVACWGEIQEEQDDKLCAEYREVLWLADCDHELHEFACVITSQLLDLFESQGERVHPMSRHAIDVKRLWIKGEATDKDLATARSSAWDAARDVAWDAARSAARIAARSSRWDGGRYAAMAAQNMILQQILFALAPQDAAK